MTERVLVVEDNPASLEMMRDWLVLQDYEVETASTLSDAMASIEKAGPDIVLLDIRLGAEDGLSLAEWLRRHPAWRHTPVIAVTAHAMVTEQERILEAGCNACISKPIEFRLLQDHLRKWLVIATLMKSTDGSLASPHQPSLSQTKGAEHAEQDPRG